MKTVLSTKKLNEKTLHRYSIVICFEDGHASRYAQWISWVLRLHAMEYIIQNSLMNLIPTNKSPQIQHGARGRPVPLPCDKETLSSESFLSELAFAKKHRIFH